MLRWEGMGSEDIAMGASSLPSVSVIIPTFNRRESLLRTLESLERQTYPVDRFEVIVVDDGGADGTEAVAQRGFPFSLQYVRQENQGAATARNRGALQSSGEFLIFVDDDIRLQPHTVERLAANGDMGKTILLGALTTPHEISAGSLFARLAHSDQSNDLAGGESQQVPFQTCMTGLLGLRRDDFFALGMFRDPTGGWPSWDDVAFGYRAHQAGYRLLRVAGAVAEHWDYALWDLSSACRRWDRAGYSGATLLWRYPALTEHIPMFMDKGPILWRVDRPALIARKLARQIVSAPPVLYGMEKLVRALETHYPSPAILERLYRWITSAYIYKGYRQGTQELEATRSG